MNEQNYITILGWFRTRLNLSGNDLLAFAIVYGFSQAEGNFFRGGIRYLETWLGVSRATVFNTLTRLRERGLIEPRARLVNGVRFVDYFVPRSIIETRGECAEKSCAETAQEAREIANAGKAPRGAPKAQETAIPRDYDDAAKIAEKGSTKPAKTTSSADDFPRFAEFWKAFPKSLRKAEKDKCLTFWRRERLDAISEAVAKSLDAWKRRWNDPQFIPAPLVWLRKKPWEADCDEETAELQERVSGGNAKRESEDFTAARNEALALVKEIRRNSERAYYEKNVYESADADATVAAVIKSNNAARERIAQITATFPALSRFLKMSARDDGSPETMF